MFLEKYFFELAIIPWYYL